MAKDDPPPKSDPDFSEKVERAATEIAKEMLRRRPWRVKETMEGLAEAMEQIRKQKNKPKP